MTNQRVTTSILLCIICLLCSAAWVGAAAPNGRWIMEQVDQRDDGNSQESDTRMILIDKRGNERVREIRALSLDQGDDSYRLQFFRAPADVRGTGFLTYDYYDGDRDDDQWLYLPDLRKTKRIATSDKSSSFMGSDFSYADMTRRVLDEWRYRLVREEQVGTDKVWIIEALPVSPRVEERYGYKKSYVYVRQDIFMVIRAIHLLSSGNKIKYMEVKNLELFDGIWVATEIWMKTTQNKNTLHRTKLLLSNIRLNEQIDADLFSIRQLEKGF